MNDAGKMRRQNNDIDTDGSEHVSSSAFGMLLEKMERKGSIGASTQVKLHNSHKKCKKKNDLLSHEDENEDKDGKGNDIEKYKQSEDDILKDGSCLTPAQLRMRRSDMLAEKILKEMNTQQWADPISVD